MTMIERIARAICEADDYDPDTLRTMHYIEAPRSEIVPLWSLYTDQAQAALEAMISEGLAEGLIENALDKVNPIGCCLMDEYDAAFVFQSIIKAAIAER